MDEKKPTDLGTLVGRLTLEQKVALLTGADFWSLPEAPEIGLRKILLSDGPAGLRGTTWDERDTSLLFPNPTALAATWDPALVRRAGSLMGAQARDKGVAWHLAPNVNMHRSPLGGRHFECFSEDPILAAQIAAGFVEGVQGAGVASTVKHYIGNESETDRLTYDALFDEATLREVYLPPFEAAVQAGAWSVMAAYNSVNGVSMAEHAELLTGLLKDDLGFDGAVVSDWFATRSTAASANAGLDVVMPGPQGPWGEALVEAVHKGEVSEAVIDDKVLRVLRLAARTGYLEGFEAPAPVTTPQDAETQLREIAARAMVVLRNEATGQGPLLPLDPGSVSRVAVIGPNASVLTAQGGGSAHVNPTHVISPLAAIAQAFGPAVTVDYAEGAVTQRLLAPITTETAIDPDTGQPGLRVDFLDASGAVLGSELRRASRFTFMGGLPEGTSGIRVRADIAIASSGTHQFSVSGIGRFRLTVGRLPSVDVTLNPSEGADMVEGLVKPPEHRVDTELETGTVRAEVVAYVDPALPFAVFGLNHGAPRQSADELFTAALEAARAADVAIVVVGTTDEIEAEGFDRVGLKLPGRQDELVWEVAKVNPRTVVVVNAGAPVEMPWRGIAPALLWAWFPGQEGGYAIADALTGVVEPAGRLPTTFPNVETDAPVLSTRPVDGKISYSEGSMFGYRGYEKAGTVPAFPFGHGLGYTSWSYEDMTAKATATGDVEVLVRVRNEGARIGREVVQIYLAGEGPDGADPQRLVGFGSTLAAPGESATVPIRIPVRALARWVEDGDGKSWRVRGGPRELIAARSAGEPRIRTLVELAERTL
ncbi:MAG: glycoside hydrolase family 3 protein [Catenulisporales bacterium]|nr:glycoside hydrolase family 3 protein [Catenulisporales bacterium]